MYAAATPADGTRTTQYEYDAANRLTSVDGVTYTWDDRGNLVSDGTFTYTPNPDFDSADSRYSDIVKRLIDLQSNLLSGQNAARVNFPFLDVHPDEISLFHTNARRNETFDHVAFFIDKHETGLPLASDNQNAGQGASNDYDYGVFDFSELFANVVHSKPFSQLTKTQGDSVYAKSKADVSDHMPIWVRVPVPGA